MSVLLANDPLVKDGTNSRKTAGILSVGFEAKSWLVGQPPMWWREEVLKSLGLLCQWLMVPRNMRQLKMQ